MHRSFKDILLYVLPTVIILSVVEAGLGSMNNGYTEKKRLLKKNLAAAEVLILGNSQAYRGINPEFIRAPSFNLAYVSQSLFYDRELVTRYAPQMPKLEVAVITITYLSLEYDLSHSLEYWRCFFYERFWGLPLETDAHSLDIRRFSLINLYGGKETIKYIGQLFQTDLSDNMNSGGASPHPGPGAGFTSADIRARIAVHHSQMHHKRVKANTAHLKAILRSLKERGIKPVFVVMPVSALYYQSMSKERYDAAQDIIRAIAGQEQVSYFNYTADGRFNEKDFQDGDHLSKEGSRKFSLILDKEVIEPLIKL